MNTPIASAAPVAGLARVLATLADMLASMMSLAQRLDAFLVAQRRAAKDRLDLASMSDRELADIGLPRASIDSAADGVWSRGQMP